MNQEAGRDESVRLADQEHGKRDFDRSVKICVNLWLKSPGKVRFGGGAETNTRGRVRSPEYLSSCSFVFTAP
jgi:hypothetical protein